MAKTDLLQGTLMWKDLRAVGRRLRREPGFTFVAVLTLTLAVGANTAILGVAEAVLFRPLPYDDPDHVFILQILDRKTGRRSTMTPYSFVDAINGLDGDVSNVGITGEGPRIIVATADGPQTVPTLAVSAQYFQILGINPVRGRLFDAQDAGREGRSAMLSYSAWQERFAGDESIVGKAVAIGNVTFDIVGVLPQDFVYPSLFAGKPEVITEMTPVARGTLGGTFHSIVRVAPGVAREQAQSRIDAAVAPVAAASTDWKDTTPVMDEVRTVLYARAASPIMRFLLVSSCLILLIGCANLANMLLVRGQRYMRETAMRLALGASRMRLIRPIFLEAIIIGIVSGGLAVIVTAYLFDVLLRHIPPIAYGSAPIGIDGRVAAISLLISLASALLFAVMPSWRAARLDVLGLLQGRTGSGMRARMGRPMVIAQVALSVVAIFGAAAAGRAFISLLNTPLGFSSENVVRITVAPPRPVTPGPAPVVAVAPGRIEVADPPRALDSFVFYTRIVEALKSRPGVLSAGASTGLPLSTSAPYGSAKLPGTPALDTVGIEYVVPGFFETIGMSLTSGRLLAWDDLTFDRSAAVLSESAARTMFGDRNPLGEIFVEEKSNREFHVVGIVGDARQRVDVAYPPRAYVFSGGSGVLNIVVKVASRNDATLAQLKAVVREVAPEALVGATWWSDSINDTTAYRNPRFQTIVLTSLGMLALAMTAVGVFGVVNYRVVSHTREMGVRLAIGASPRSLIAYVLKSALMPVLAGLGIGMVAIRWISPFAEAQLFKINTHDPLTLALAALTVAIATLAAAYVPAKRAAAVDPLSVLRRD